MKTRCRFIPLRTRALIGGRSGFCPQQQLSSAPSSPGSLCGGAPVDSKDVAYRFQITFAITFFGEQETPFGPLVPGVQQHNARRGGHVAKMLVGIAAELLESLRCVA